MIRIAFGLLALMTFALQPSSPLDYSVAGGPDTLQYLFIGHAYDHFGDGKEVDPRLEGLDYSQFNEVVLGGDVCSEATQEYNTLAYLDNLFDLGDTNHHYVLGNHDARNENLLWIQKFTERPSYYVHSRAGIVWIILNTTFNARRCAELDAQYRMLESVCDTVSEASHLILLHHHAIATDVPGLPNNWYYANWPLYFWDSNCFDSDPSYLQTIYPMLLQVQSRGVEVLNVSGDLGFSRKKMDTTSTDGIRYLASGIDNSRYTNDSLALDSAAKDLVLIFEHVPQNRSLEWKFHDLDSIYNAHQ